MSKYINTENLKWHSPDESIVKPLTEFYVTESDMADLPSIEVSEELPKDIVEPIGNGNVIMSEDTYNELIERPVSEDCISREKVAKRLAELWETEHPDRSYDEWLEIAREWCRFFPPSVVPSAEQSSVVGECERGDCNTCRHNGCYMCCECINGNCWEQADMRGAENER